MRITTITNWAQRGSPHLQQHGALRRDLERELPVRRRVDARGAVPRVHGPRRLHEARLEPRLQHAGGGGPQLREGHAAGGERGEGVRGDEVGAL